VSPSREGNTLVLTASRMNMFIVLPRRAQDRVEDCICTSATLLTLSLQRSSSGKIKCRILNRGTKSRSLASCGGLLKSQLQHDLMDRTFKSRFKQNLPSSPTTSMASRLGIIADDRWTALGLIKQGCTSNVSRMGLRGATSHTRLQYVKVPTVNKNNLLQQC